MHMFSVVASLTADAERTMFLSRQEDGKMKSEGGSPKIKHLKDPKSLLGARRFHISSPVDHVCLAFGGLLTNYFR